MQLEVFSEIGRLREVMTHRPGREVDCMPPALMEDLLFDDILHGPSAREEHDAFVAVLEAFGVTNHDIQTLLEEALAVDEAHTGQLISLVAQREQLRPKVESLLRELSPAELASALICGIAAPPEEMRQDRFFSLPPVPNALMARDPAVVLGHGLIISSMKRKAREREALLSRFIHNMHPLLTGNARYLDFQEQPEESMRYGNLSLEGGDVLLLSEGIVAVGVSERTMERSIDLLAETLRPLEPFRKLIMVRMPDSRSQMHLDTIFTRVSENECLVYPPMLMEGYAETLSTVSIDLTPGSKDLGRRHRSFFGATKEAGLDLEPIPCGGSKSYIQQSREQWTDGANSFALAPGLIVLYRRNDATLEELQRYGFEVVLSREFVADVETHRAAVEAGGKRVVVIASSELSRARGGPRCMTMPLRRDPLAA